MKNREIYMYFYLFNIYFHLFFEPFLNVVELLIRGKYRRNLFLGNVLVI